MIEGEDLPRSGPSDSSGRATIFATLNIDQHGVSPTTAWCAFEDTGSASIPASVVDALQPG